MRDPRRGADLEGEQADTATVGSSLDHFIGSWTQRQADEMDRALEDFEGIDESMWMDDSSLFSGRRRGRVPRRSRRR